MDAADSNLQSKAKGLDTDRSQNRFDYKQYLPILLQESKNDARYMQSILRTKSNKSNAESLRFREIGNKLFREKKDSDSLDKALTAYMESIAYALPDSQEIAISYANRSAVFFFVDLLVECLKDIETALSLNYPEELKPKLLFRKGECCVKLANDSLMDSKFWLKAVPLNDDSRQTMKRHLRNCPSAKERPIVLDESNIIPELKSPSQKYRCASDAVQVCYSKTSGRHVVATRDIEIGEVLVVEKPYATILDQNNFYSHCSYCTNNIWNGIPCEHCVNCVYCSEVCKSEAWEKYHHLECSFLNFMLDHQIHSHQLLTIRLVLRAITDSGGIDEFKAKFEKLRAFTKTAEWKKGDRWFENYTFENIFFMKTHREKISHQADHLREADFTKHFILYFGFNTSSHNLFDNQYTLKFNEYMTSLSQNPKALFIGELVYKLSFLTLAFQMVTEEEHSAQASRGHAAYSLLNCFNHSCLPNVRQQDKNGYTIIKAALPIKQGDQLFYSYNLLCVEASVAKRQKFFKEGFHFTCRCLPCRENWPQYDDMKSIWKQMKPSAEEEKTKRALIMIKDWKKFQKSWNINIISSRGFSRTEEILKKYNSLLKLIYEETYLPSQEFFNVTLAIDDIQCRTGSISRKYYLDHTGSKVTSLKSYYIKDGILDDMGNAL